ncbi:MAG: crosslink repair DNA glycosylase YcaQ family protein [Candidatus Bathyarchaeota archaeon]
MGVQSSRNLYGKEEAKEFALRRLHLTPDTLGKGERDVLPIIRDIGGLQYGGHHIELLNRFIEYDPAWLDELIKKNRIIEGHVLRGALRIVPTEDYKYYFKATRVVARRRRYQNCPESLQDHHSEALEFLREHGPQTLIEFMDNFGKEHPELKKIARRIVADLYNHGEVVRIGRKGNRPIYLAIDMFPGCLDIEAVSEVEAMEWLFLRCLATYGPLTIREIAHWVGWNLTETRKIVGRLMDVGKVVEIEIEGDLEPNYLMAEDRPVLDLMMEDLPDYLFVRVLFNDDSLLLGCYKRLGNYFGYPWSYPQLRKGDALRPALLKGRELIGEASVGNLYKSETYSVTSLTLRSEYGDPKTVSMIEKEFSRHAEFYDKTLDMARPKLI